MNSSEFENNLEDYPHLLQFFVGIFSIDTLPRYFKLRTFCFCNTDTSEGMGKHWLCFVKTEKNSIECFDSLGIDETKKNLLLKYCKIRNVKNIEYNETQFQTITSSTCGYFVLYFAIHRMHNLDLNFEDVLEDIFSLNLIDNEEKVKEFCDTLKNTNHNGRNQP